MADKPFAADAQQFGQAMNNIAYGETMMAAIRDYKKELLENQKGSTGNQQQQVDVEELLDDKDLQQLHADRIAQLKQEAEKRQNMSLKGHGSLTEITEGEFLEVVTKTEHVVCHFFHKEFEKCKVMDKHLSMLARKYFKTRFIKLSAPDSPFFSVKLNIKVLPCVVSFHNGVSIHRITGFEGLGTKDDFPTEVLEDILLLAGVVLPEKREDQDDDLDRPNGNIRKGFQHYDKTHSDEDSDFD